VVSGRIGVVENEGVVRLPVLVVVGFLLLVEGLVVGPIYSRGVPYHLLRLFLQPIHGISLCVLSYVCCMCLS
jgi:hypothetical protein